MGETRSVLVVDDEEDIRDGVERRLRAVGYNVFTAADGVEGVQSAKDHLPDAILLDVLMPKLNGMQALAALQENEQTCHIPVVMLSASLRDENCALEAGARFFLPKPYNGKALLESVKVAIDERCPA